MRNNLLDLDFIIQATIKITCYINQFATIKLRKWFSFKGCLTDIEKTEVIWNLRREGNSLSLVKIIQWNIRNFSVNMRKTRLGT